GMEPQDNFSFINSYLSRVSPVIRKYQGFIDKYIGDAVMALFPTSADDALQGAIAMQEQVTLYNQHRQNHGYLPIKIGIGIHTGNLMLGTIGSDERMETTVIADAVNLASRIEGLTKYYGAGILISEETRLKLDNLPSYNYRFVAQVKVKGRQKIVEVFEVYDGDSEEIRELKTDTKAKFEEALSVYYQQHFAQAKQIFQEIWQTNPEDKAAKLYLERCEQYQRSGVPEHWSGVEALNQK
ncbi:MAG: adenylate/guanylate cyclase domain-containing protein, partial [Symploca sp. SIO3E6]|nr:adenylate/guanylate cyclase domain-containing protein [Caldora sp. SIO3E6]